MVFWDVHARRRCDDGDFHGPLPMSLERHLVLNRWLSRRLGAEGIAHLKGDFQLLEPGVAGETGSTSSTSLSCTS